MIANNYLRHFRDVFFPPRNGTLTSLYLTHSILNFGQSLIGIFIPVYIFQRTGNFFYLPAFYGIVSATAVAVFLAGASFIARQGVTRLVLAANLFRIVNLVLLLLVPLYPFLVFVAGAFEGLVPPTYWVSYHLIFAARGHDGNFGKEVGWMGIFVSIVSALAPLAGGLVVSIFGFTALYGLGMIIILLSSLPIVFVGDHLGFHSMTAAEIVKGSFAPGWRWLSAGLAAMRLEIYFSTIFWPLFLFAVLNSYTALGGLTTLQIVVGVVLMMLAGRIVDKLGPRKVFPWPSAALAPFWLMVGYVTSAAALVPLIIYRAALGPFYGISADALYYSLARRDPYGSVIKREFILHSSAVVSCLIAAALWYFFPANWPVIFSVAALGPFLAIVKVKAR